MSNNIYRTARILFVIGLLAAAAQSAEDFSTTAEYSDSTQNAEVIPS